MPPFHRPSYRTTFIEKRAALLSLTSHFHTSFRTHSSASPRRASNTHELHAKTPAVGAASSPARLWRAGRDVAATSKRHCRAAKPFRGGLRVCGARGEAAPLPRRPASRGARGAAPIASPSRLPAERHSPDRTGSRQQLSASPEKARTAARAGGSIGSGRRAAPRSQAAAPALRGWQAAGKSAKCGKRRPYSMCPVSAPRRGAEWQMRILLPAM